MRWEGPPDPTSFRRGNRRTSCFTKGWTLNQVNRTLLMVFEGPGLCFGWYLRGLSCDFSQPREPSEQAELAITCPCYVYIKTLLNIIHIGPKGTLFWQLPGMLYAAGLAQRLAGLFDQWRHHLSRTARHAQARSTNMRDLPKEGTVHHLQGKPNSCGDIWGHPPNKKRSKFG